MIIHDLKQGTPGWDEFRLNHFGASEAAAMLGLSSKVTRNELLHMKHTGQAKEYSDWVENVLFANGHDTEKKARLILEDEIKDDFYPVTCSDGIYSASCDGMTLDGSVAFEHKQYNQQLADSVRNGVLPDEYMPQCQQILMVTGANALIFVVSDGTADNREKMNILPDAEWFKRIQDGWHRFGLDLEDYKPKDIKEKPEPEAIMQLPALSIQIKGEVIASNLPLFKTEAEAFIAQINTDLKTDEDFANAEANVKYCKKTEDALEAAKKAAIAQTASIDEVMRTIDHIKEQLRVKRIDLDKKVKQEKESIKAGIIKTAKHDFDAHVSGLSAEIMPVSLVVEQPDFIRTMKNKRTLESLHNAADTELARCKIVADSVAKDIRAKLAWFNSNIDGHDALFRDLQSIIYKAEDDFRLVVKTRIDDQKREIAEAEKAAAERARIEDEESQRKIEAEQAAKNHAAKQNVTEKTETVEVKRPGKQIEQNPQKRITKIEEIENSLAKIVDSCRSTDNIPRIIALAIADGKIPHVSVNGIVEKTA